MRGFFRDLMLKRKMRRAISARRDFHLPDDLTSPDSLAVLCGDSVEDVWPALYLMESIRNHYQGARTRVICTERDRPLFSAMVGPDDLLSYREVPTESLERLAEVREERSIAFFPYRGISLAQASFLAQLRPLVSVGPLEHPCIGVSVRLSDDCRMPDMVHAICEVLHIQPRKNYRPSVSRSEMARAATVLAPVSGRAMPFVSCTRRIKNMLRDEGAEIPLKTVVLKGDHPDLRPSDRSLFLAVLGSSSVVLTDDPAMWGDACALGIPVVGLDERGSFPRWRSDPASGREEFLQSWNRLLREGW